MSRQERIGFALQALNTTVKMLDSNFMLADNSSVPLSNTARLFAQLAAFDEITQQTMFKETVLQYFDIRGIDGSGNLSTRTNLYGMAAQQIPAGYERKQEIIMFTTSGFVDDHNAKIMNPNFECGGCNPSSDPDPQCYARKTSSNPTPPFSSSPAELNISSLTNAIMDNCNNYKAQTEFMNPTQPPRICISYYTNALREMIVQVNGGPTGLPSASERIGESLWSLSRAFQRLARFDDMQLYLRSYISNQYNLLIENITSTDPNFNNWNSTESSHMDMQRRLAITYTLLAGIGMPELSQENNTSETGGLPIPSISTQSNASAKPSAGTIAGGSIGAMVFVAILISTCVIFNRRRRRNQLDSSNKISAPEPFTLQISDKQLITTDNAPRNWQLKDRSGRNWIEVGGGTDVADVVPRSRRYSSPATLVPVQEPVPAAVNLAGEERDRDSGWRPSGAHVRLPPRYEDAM
ncbi:hypothetical protein VNI00_017024 [Paramarasmius palmivorus]|uniref:Uncharacterized protein n=1 Tax=Paramarasmius palmivorus TaxID=297713 RepID=A0AAW0BB38_9AGAR